MHKILLGLLVLGLLVLGKPLVLPTDTNVTIVPLVPLLLSGPLDSLWVDKDVVSVPEKYRLYRDDGIFLE